MQHDECRDVPRSGVPQYAQSKSNFCAWVRDAAAAADGLHMPSDIRADVRGADVPTEESVQAKVARWGRMT